MSSVLALKMQECMEKAGLGSKTVSISTKLECSTPLRRNWIDPKY